ncbi:MAG: hypothetical protein HZA53_01085 [Planctomycetes bacterium]|nr:hypothetical protein [Planctomycetota bacterium]
MTLGRLERQTVDTIEIDDTRHPTPRARASTSQRYRGRIGIAQSEWLAFPAVQSGRASYT